MVCPDSAQIRAQLEKAYQKSASIPFHQQFWAFLQRVGTLIVDELTRDRHQPRISKYYNADGKALWHVYDPKNNANFTATSESELLEWLDHRGS